MFRKGKSVVGLDLGSQVIKAIEITLEGPEPVITGFARVEVPPDGDRTEALRETFKQGRFRARNVITAVAGQSVVVRYVPMPNMSMPAHANECQKHTPGRRWSSIRCPRTTRSLS